MPQHVLPALCVTALLHQVSGTQRLLGWRQVHGQLLNAHFELL